MDADAVAASRRDKLYKPIIRHGSIFTKSSPCSPLITGIKRWFASSGLQIPIIDYGPTFHTPKKSSGVVKLYKIDKTLKWLTCFTRLLHLNLEKFPTNRPASPFVHITTKTNIFIFNSYVTIKVLIVFNQKVFRVVTHMWLVS